jgi:starvation-inducible DNA-binding protein
MTTGTVTPMLHAADDVIAVIDGDARADAAVAALRAAGVTDADIHVVRGREGVVALADAWWRHSGVPGSLAPLLAAVLSDERDMEAIYGAEGLAGHTVLAVHIHSPDDVDEATRVLRACGAHDTWYFGPWTRAPLDHSVRLQGAERERRVKTMTIDAESPAHTPAVSPVADALARLLADTYTLSLKTHGYHWNVTGPQFRSLHLLFEEQYEELADAVDEIAERIRALGPMAPGSYREMARLTAIDDKEGVPDAMGMIGCLIDAHEVVVRTARALMTAAEQADDPASLDLATRRISVHEKALWMLRATMRGGDDHG